MALGPDWRLGILTFAIKYHRQGKKSNPEGLGDGGMIDFFKRLMEQALDLGLTVRFTRRDGEWFAALGGELDSLSLEELEEYRAELENRLCDMDGDEPEGMAGEEFEQWADAHESLEDLLSEAQDRIDELS